MAETVKRIPGGNYHKGLLTIQQSCGISACSSDTALDMHVTNTLNSFKLIGWGLQGTSENYHIHYPESRSATSGGNLCASVSGDWKSDLKRTLTSLAYRGVSLATKPLTNKRLNESTIRTIPPHAQPDLQGSKPDSEVQVCPQGDKFPDALEGFGEKSARVVMTTTMDTNTVGKPPLGDGILYTFKATLEAHSPGI
ncbi:hypothetical protein SARC_05321 [Sphaeroforma arctica JP610]|uniref:Uncharacterized protein n=1 Tax=Sphaeroforma arctica JP610 TaxID=667725 RepID=A0A0L0G0K9_9EUKA|nr:hypothetical protein SARC_05321 [Sphaeroforma arctica JP610]KNC82394.1 hypothetical protein SARC_05321 [Sphaeroforma arctica JP610]|eukprot:XP_014156296.1 hypothetical protein SARC_05321 [Sphaeroforma arctica JP610]